MTFVAYMRGTVMFLSIAKTSLSQMVSYSEVNDRLFYELELNAAMGTGLIIACVASLESYFNNLCKYSIDFEWYDELKLESKLELICKHIGKEVDWGAEPFQTIREMIRRRNWLVHFKEEKLGLVGAGNCWLEVDGHYRIPRNDPFKIFSIETCRHYYDSTRKVIIDIGILSGQCESEYEFINSENYTVFVLD